ncbi:hypothetical protein ACPPVW_03805 [Leifsonia sp. McL0607]|uniref:hypothetical protein n=1 Tax=Leifsonia sp. McL0607 TaxID=3415672 RepID=UPI003CECBB8D
MSGELTDGDPSNGEADVIVAENHEGAGFGHYRHRDHRESLRDLHRPHPQAECPEGPVPGVAGATLPIVQTGSYGENIGQITLTVDGDTKEVTDLTDRVSPRSRRSSTRRSPTRRSSANQKVGTVTSDMTTAYVEGA